MSQVLLSVVIVTHNHEQYIEKCIESLIPEVKQVNGEIIVVDNLSDDDSAAIAQKYPSVKVLINDKRRGFSENNNAGMSHAQGQYILLINPDTEILSGALKKLIAFMDNHPHVGMCGAQLFFPSGEVQLSPRKFPNLKSFIARRTPFRRFLQNSAWNKSHLMANVVHSEPVAVDWLLGACMFIRREVIETVGPLDEGFYLYVEDIDWAKRMHQNNWQVFYVPQAKIIHHHLAVSDKKMFSFYTWLHIRSMVRYVRKHMLPPIWGLKIEKSLWNSAKKNASTEVSRSILGA